MDERVSHVGRCHGGLGANRTLSTTKMITTTKRPTVLEVYGDEVP